MAAGDRAEALRSYERLRSLLAEELGVPPARESECLYEEALS
jgi:DNA-binding SARP family transcriptional activator